MVIEFRTDVHPTSDEDLLNWLEYSIRSFHYIDILRIHDFLQRAIDDKKMNDVLTRENKMCDKCELVYPEVITICSRCSNDRLRSFKIHNNLHELARNWK